MTAAPHPTLRRLTKRREFVRAARGKRAGRTAFGMQAIASDHAEAGIGITVTKKVGTATERNRIRRRLRAAIRTCAAAFPLRHDFVLVGRREALTAPFGTLTGDIAALLDKLTAARPAGTDTAGHRKDRQ